VQEKNMKEKKGKESGVGQLGCHWASHGEGKKRKREGKSEPAAGPTPVRKRKMA
jgi:hypothetical protein